MGTYHKDGYSAHVEGFFVVRDRRLRVAKSNGSRFVLVEPCELPSGTEGELLVIVDGNKMSRRVMLPDGVAKGEVSANYQVVAPF